MATQDRNVHRDAQFAREQLPVTLTNPTPINEDHIVALFRPRYNFRVTDLQASVQVVTVGAAVVRACIARELSAVGAPQFTAAAAVTFLIQAFTQLDSGVFVAKGTTAAQAFTAAFTVTDGFWGVVTVQIDGAQVITTKVAANIMAFATEAEAIQNAPSPDASNGLVDVLTIEASGADFVGATDNTDTANSFNTVDRGGHAATLAVLATEQGIRSTQATRLRVAGLGNLIGSAGDFVAVTIRGAALALLTNGQAFAEVRKFPLVGEAGPDLATGLTTPAVP